MEIIRKIFGKPITGKFYLLIEENIKFDSGERGHSEKLYFKAKRNWCGYGKGLWWHVFFQPKRSFGAFGIGYVELPPRKARKISKKEANDWYKKYKHLNEYIEKDMNEILVNEGE